MQPRTIYRRTGTTPAHRPGAALRAGLLPDDGGLRQGASHRTATTASGARWRSRSANCTATTWPTSTSPPPNATSTAPSSSTPTRTTVEETIRADRPDPREDGRPLLPHAPRRRHLQHPRRHADGRLCRAAGRRPGRAEARGAADGRLRPSAAPSGTPEHGGLDGFALCADYCFNTGPFLSPRQFAEFVTPYLARITRLTASWASTSSSTPTATSCRSSTSLSRPSRTRCTRSTRRPTSTSPRSSAATATSSA